MGNGPFLGTSEFAATVLERLAASGHRPDFAVTLPDRRQGRGRKESPSPVATKAEQLGIEVFKCADVNEAEARAKLTSTGAEWGSICAFGQLIKEPLLSDLPMLNVHPSLLPRWRGAAPIERAIMAGDEMTGVAVMRLVAGLDSGPVAMVEQTAIEESDDFGTLSSRLAGIGGDLLVRALDAAGEDRLEWTEQSEDEVTYAEKITADDRRLDPAGRAVELHDRVRALNPHVGAYLALEGDDRLGVREVTVIDRASWGPGSVIGEDGDLLLACGDRTIRLDLVQPPGKTAMDGGSYLRGYGLPDLARPVA
ncbi:MAG TPA: methionyl-tRNA formyltransferase [Solirubrobacterales bacterium]|nr:methionyl-tRNA formyltransferase [Solirubrobacterales bacterium]